MHISAGRVCMCAAAALVVSCSTGDRVLLTVDFTTRESWNYDFSLSVGGRVTLGDSVSSFSNSLKCRLVGHGDTTDPSLLHVVTQDVSVESEAFDEDEAQDLTRLLETFTVSFSLSEGFVGFDDSVSIPIVKAGHWDLYRHFVKMLPLLPGGRVRPGFSWERHKQIPLPTNHGDALGQLYQSFRFDSLVTGANGHRDAHLSWSFSYAVDVHDADTAGLLDDMPHKGSGRGAAVLDIDRRILRTAAVEFSVPHTVSSSVFSVEWDEKVSIVLGQ